MFVAKPFGATNITDAYIRRIALEIMRFCFERSFSTTYLSAWRLDWEVGKYQVDFIGKIPPDLFLTPPDTLFASLFFSLDQNQKPCGEILIQFGGGPRLTENRPLVLKPVGDSYELTPQSKQDWDELTNRKEVDRRVRPAVEA